MTEGDAACRAVKETTVFLSHFKDLPDYRQKGKVAYPLEEVLLLMLAAALAGAETVADIARFGRAKLAFLRRFSTLRQRHALARPVGHHPRQARSGGVPALFCGVGGGADEDVGRSDRHPRVSPHRR